MKKSLPLLLAALVLVGISTNNAFGCFAVVVGKKISTDGSVLLGHNEQNSGERFLNFRKIPRMSHPDGSVIVLKNGATMPQVPVTYGFLWSQNPGCVSSDAYINEYGVAIVSDYCPDRNVEKVDDSSQDKEKVDLAYMFRRLLIERAKTAREAVQVGADLIAKYGYASTRTFVIADPNEAWLMSVTNGKQWVAEKVPDDKVVLLPNVYIIAEVNLSDKDNFIGSPDLIDYAVKQGWYDPKSGKPFRFDEAYSLPREKLVDPRQRVAQSIVTAQNINQTPDRRLPMMVTPAKKMDIKDVLTVLRYSNIKHTNQCPAEVVQSIKKLCQTCAPESDHQFGDISAPNVQEAAIFQLRNFLPPSIGCVYWRVTGEPSVGVLTPWYLGIIKTPANYHSAGDLNKILTEENHFSQTENNFKPLMDKAWWIFKTLQDLVDQDTSGTKLKIVREIWNNFEKKEYKKQPRIDGKALGLFNNKGEFSSDLYLTCYCFKQAIKAEEIAKKLIVEFNDNEI